MRRNRRTFSAQEKAEILKQHLVEKKAISEVCDAHGLQPTVFYRWLKALFENAELALEAKRPAKESSAQKSRIEQLEAKLRSKDEVLGELMGEYVAVKKKLGEN